jgi:SHS2 domain-containing protein
LIRKVGLPVKETDRKAPFRELDHTADLRVEIRGKDEQELFRNAVESLYLLLGLQAVSDRRDAVPAERLEIQGQDPEEALVELLGELLYRATAEKQRLNLQELSVQRGEEGEGGGCRVGVRGVWETITQGEMAGKSEIKAVTYHDVEIRRTKRGWTARVVMDL